jgi:mannose-1-phosphate guanylyltransferase
VKAFLLAAGLGTRLRPLTDHTPKCLIPIGGRPLLDIWLDSLAKIGVTDVLLNVHHLAPVVRAHVLARSGPPDVLMVEEPTLLGSAGTLLANREFVDGEDIFLAVYADNLTDFDLGVLVDAQRRGAAEATVAVFHAPRPSACGIVEAVDGVMVGFVEKPAEPRSDLANAGMYAFRPSVLDLLDGEYPLDIGFDLLPRLVNRARVVSIGDSYLIDIGTPAALERARVEWQARVRT